MSYIDQQGFIRYTQEEEDTIKETGSHFTPNGYKSSEWVGNIMKWLLGDYKNNNTKNENF